MGVYFDKSRKYSISAEVEKQFAEISGYELHIEFIRRMEDECPPKTRDIEAINDAIIEMAKIIKLEDSMVIINEPVKGQLKADKNGNLYIDYYE